MIRAVALVAVCALTACSNTQNDEGPGVFVLDAMLEDDLGAVDMAPPPPDVDLVINEVSASDDYVELINRGPALDLTGWSIADDGYDPAAPDTDDHRFALPARLLGAGERLLLDQLPFGIGSSDAIALLSPQSAVVDAVDWLEGDADPALCRLPDRDGEFHPCSATPNAPNHAADEAPPSCGDGLIGPNEMCDGPVMAGRTCADFGFVAGELTCDEDCIGFDTSRCTAPIVVINEVVSSGDDAIELHNAGDAPADLSGWLIADDGYEVDDPSTVDHTQTLAGTLEPGAYRVLIKGDDYAFGLGGEDGVRLFDADGALVDETAWRDGDATIAWCRQPDATGPFVVCDAATLGAANE